MGEVVRELRAGESLADFDHRERGVPTQWPVAERTCRTPQWRMQANLQKNPLLFTPFQKLGNPRITTIETPSWEKNTHILLGAPHCTNNHTLYLKGLSHDSVSLQYVSSFSCSHHCPCIINLVVLWDKIHYEKPGFQWGVVWGVMGFKSKCSKGSQIEPLGSEHFARNTGFPRGLTTISPYVPCKKFFWGVWHPTSRHCQGSYVCRYIASSTWLLC